MSSVPAPEADLQPAGVAASADDQAGPIAVTPLNYQLTQRLGPGAGEVVWGAVRIRPVQSAASLHMPNEWNKVLVSAHHSFADLSALLVTLYPRANFGRRPWEFSFGSGRRVGDYAGTKVGEPDSPGTHGDPDRLMVLEALGPGESCTYTCSAVGPGAGQDGPGPANAPGPAHQVKRIAAKPGWAGRLTMSARGPVLVEVSVREFPPEVRAVAEIQGYRFDSTGRVTFDPVPLGRRPRRRGAHLARWSSQGGLLLRASPPGRPKSCTGFFLPPAFTPRELICLLQGVATDKEEGRWLTTSGARRQRGS